MLSKKLSINNTTGLHLRPAGVLYKRAMRFDSVIKFQIKDYEANAKSVLSILGACVRNGDELLFTFDGHDEEQAMDEITQIIERGLREE